MDDNGWIKYGKLVLAELESHNGRLNNIDDKLDNHITHIEHRLTAIETNYRSIKWILGFIFTVIMGIFCILLTSYVG